jgi:hypothetical protein
MPRFVPIRMLLVGTALSCSRAGGCRDDFAIRYQSRDIVRYDLDRVSDIQLLQHGDLAADPVERLPVDPSALLYAGTTREDTVIRLKDSLGKKPEGDITSVECSRACHSANPFDE